MEGIFLGDVDCPLEVYVYVIQAVPSALLHACTVDQNLHVFQIRQGRRFRDVAAVMPIGGVFDGSRPEVQTVDRMSVLQEELTDSLPYSSGRTRDKYSHAAASCFLLFCSHLVIGMVMNGMKHDSTTNSITVPDRTAVIMSNQAIS